MVHVHARLCAAHIIQARTQRHQREARELLRERDWLVLRRRRAVSALCLNIECDCKLYLLIRHGGLHQQNSAFINYYPSGNVVQRARIPPVLEESVLRIIAVKREAIAKTGALCTLYVCVRVVVTNSAKGVRNDLYCTT